jgi:beta-carotene hydroxylase
MNGGVCMKNLVAPPKWQKRSTEWPTVWLFFGSFGTFLTSLAIAAQLSPLWWPPFMIINALCIYSIFSVIHEACHKNISRDYPRFEYALGFISTFLFHASFEQFTVLHLRHHSKVNHRGEDPDLLSEGPLTFKKVFFWGGTLVSYFSFFIKNKLYRKTGIVPLVIPYTMIACIYAAGYHYGFLATLVGLWLVPYWLGLILIVYVFDHLPHNPHKSTDRYQNTRVLTNRKLDWLTFMQTYHLVHHLWPSIPWVQYRECYSQKRNELLAAGAVEVKIFNDTDTESDSDQEKTESQSAA